MATFLVSDSCMVVVLNMHIPPQWSRARQRDLVHRAYAALPLQYAAISSVLGDLNFDYDSTVMQGSPTRKPVAKWLADLFYNRFVQFTELAHDEATHIGISLCRSSTTCSRTAQSQSFVTCNRQSLLPGMGARRLLLPPTTCPPDARWSLAPESSFNPFQSGSLVQMHINPQSFKFFQRRDGNLGQHRSSFQDARVSFDMQRRWLSIG